MTAKVGVFIPTYNAAEFLDTAIQSVLNQTYQNFDLVVLNDASSDHTQTVLDKYRGHQKIRLIDNESNLGMSRNWNKGISLLRNEYIAKLDADDYYHPEFLASVVPVLDENATVGLVFTASSWISSRSWDVVPYTESWIAPGKIFLRNLNKQFTLHSPTILVRRECYSRLGGFVESMRIHADWEMWTRISTNYDIAYVCRLLAYFRRHSGNCTAASHRDTRTPDDFKIWLKLLDDRKLPYMLGNADRELLERKMIQITRGLMEKTIHESRITATACLEFMIKNAYVPVYEKLRYKLVLAYLRRESPLALLFLKGSRWTQKLWDLDHKLRIELPARNPFDALEIS